MKRHIKILWASLCALLSFCLIAQESLASLQNRLASLRSSRDSYIAERDRFPEGRMLSPAQRVRRRELLNLIAGLNEKIVSTKKMISTMERMQGG